MGQMDIERELAAAMSYRQPEGQKWSTFYRRKTKFVAVEFYSDEKSVIEAKVKAVVDVFANDAAEIFATIEKALPATASAA
jgi:hypothetical protein